MNTRLCLTSLLACVLTPGGIVHGAEAPMAECLRFGDAAPSMLTTAAAPAALRHLYVTPYGFDGNPGTQVAPFQSISRAAVTATPGTTVHVAAGSYRETIKTEADGTARARIRYVSDTKWGAHIIGDGTEAMWTNHGDFTDIVGFDITGSGRMGIANHASHTLVQGNRVHDLSVSGGCTGAGGAGIVNANYSASHGDVIGNVVHDIGVPGQCNHVHGIYSSNPGGRIANNIVFRASSYGIHLWHAATSVLVANNTVFANGAIGMGGGILIGAGNNPGGVVIDHTRVINNIVINNPAASIRQFCYTDEHCIGANNIVANNLVHGNGSPITLLVGRASGTITADPQFVDYQPNGGGNLRLRRGSPAIKRGASHCAPVSDIDDGARSRGAPDLGAYESR